MISYLSVRATARAVLLMGTLSVGLHALTIKEFRKYPAERQATFISGAISMVAYDLAVRGNAPRARCVREWYFGAQGKEATGPNELAKEIGTAERQDAERMHVEGVVLGTLERVCKPAR